ncbi:MAG: hypothetical protein Ct9H300mP16_03320 [Pseudomonadota bacterium]|nr:MAG: hypothetical protein Ct9H300mP16_03320 [Pseudomonadota bacterium]
MAPRVKDESYAWLDPSSAYINARAFDAMVNDLLAPFLSERIDLVAAVDAAGYVLGTALALRLGCGVLTVRKAGKLPVPTDEVEFLNYSKRAPASAVEGPGPVNPAPESCWVYQWIETGGTIGAAIELLERQGGCDCRYRNSLIEESPEAEALRKKYRCVASVRPGSEFQGQ